MKKIQLNLSKIPTKDILKKYEDRIRDINQKMNKFESKGHEFLGWKDLPETFNKDEFNEIIKKVKELHKEEIEILVVIGIGGSFIGSKAAIDFVLGHYPFEGKQKMEIIFVGTSLSSIDLSQKLKYVAKKSFAINVISKSGVTLEPAVTFRFFKQLLEDSVGINNAKKYIFVTTDANKGPLFKLSKEKEYTRFVIPDNIGGRFSVLTAAGLFPIAAAGIDIKALMRGAYKSNQQYSIDSVYENDAYKYATIRHFLHSNNYNIEILSSYEPNFSFLIEWWKQLFGESEGKEGKGIFPVQAIFTRDLHSIGQFIQEGKKTFFETIIKLVRPEIDIDVIEIKDNFDNLNYLIGKTIHEINNAAFEATLDAHVNIAKVPNLILEIEDNSPETLGWLFIFFQRACAMSAYLLGINPFNQPGVEIYKANMFKILEKPE